jgi:Putative addiction module component
METTMPDSAEKLLREALELKPAERAALADELLSSLDQPNEKIDQLWAQEAEDRLRAFRMGDLKAYAATEVLADEPEKP